MWPGPRFAAEDWLLSTIVKIVTSYTCPGDRVLLLAVPRPATPGDRLGAARVRTPRERREYDGLLDARWAVFRLGRTAQTCTDAAGANHAVDAAAGVVDTESSPGPRTTRTAARGVGERNSDQTSRGAVDRGADSVDLIITAVEPTVPHHLGLRRWTNRLTGRGMVVVITHSHHDGSGLHDPTGAVVRSARRSGLHFLDHIAVLGAVTMQQRSESSTPTASSAKSFSDILVFTAAPPGTTVRGHCGDLR
ncbi:hypothetical protein [Crossiella sp. CA198]|uniref:hypothetical protein n=1 Tax=Crossiella sp. CA198 TaxID=3455607 RepID=UPI003F8D7907